MRVRFDTLFPSKLSFVSEVWYAKVHISIEGDRVHFEIEGWDRLEVV